MAENSKKYLKKRMKDYPTVPYEPLIIIIIPDKPNIIIKSILLKTFNS